MVSLPKFGSLVLASVGIGVNKEKSNKKIINFNKNKNGKRR